MLQELNRPSKPPSDSVRYGLVLADENGKPFNGTDKYVLRVPPNIVKKEGYYSITLSPNGSGVNGIPTGKPFYAILRAYVPVPGADLRVMVQTN